METAIRHGLNVNWLISGQIPDDIEKIHKETRARGFRKQWGFRNSIAGTNFIWPLFFGCIAGMFLLNNRKTSVNFVLLTVGCSLFIAEIAIDIFNFVMKRKIKRV